jgi:hypothetical protein
MTELRRQPARGWLARWLDAPGRFASSASRRVDAGRGLAEQVWRGWLPEAQFLRIRDLPDFHAAYQRTCIEREIRVMANVTDWQAFGRSSRLAAVLTAQEVNRSQLGRELGMHHETSGRWLDLLKAAFQWYEVPSFSGNSIKRLSE